MITRNLTLTNGVTSETPITVSGITFQVDTKLAVNPATTFPFTVEVGSFMVVGIDFDDTVYSGDYTESLTVNTLSGRYDIVHDVTIDDLSEVPSIIDDFEAISGLGEVTFSWTNATGNPAPTYNIYEDNVEIATDVDQSYVRTIAVGAYVYRVEASNSRGQTQSNNNLGVSASLPTAIADFAASDDEVGQITMTFTPSMGTPSPRHTLYEDTIEIATNIPSGYIHTIAESTHNYYVIANNGAGTITSNDDDGTSVSGEPVLTPPSEITDFAASDYGVGNITMTWTDSIGNPIPTYALFENDIAVVGAEDISDGYVHTVAVGTYTYRVDALNSEGTEPSNDDDGTSTAGGSTLLVSLNGELTGEI